MPYSYSLCRIVNLSPAEHCWRIIFHRHHQLVLALRDCVTSFPVTAILEDERHQSKRDVLIRRCIQMRPLDGKPAIIRPNSAPGFKALTDDPLLKQRRITL